MKSWQALLLGAVIAIVGVLCYAFIVENNKPDTLGERFSEGVEEIADEIDDAN